MEVSLIEIESLMLRKTLNLRYQAISSHCAFFCYCLFSFQRQIKVSLFVLLFVFFVFILFKRARAHAFEI